jgi:RNA ligase.
MKDIYKYPRTPHIEGSGIQRGDENMEAVPLRELVGRPLVVEEKMDGTNCAVSFDKAGNLLLQSRGHYLVGGPRERQFYLFKMWANSHLAELKAALGARYVMYGEWLYAKHTVYYTDLPHYFMEFDILDKTDNVFLSTERRANFLRNLPFVVSVKVLYEGKIKKLKELTSLLDHSQYINDNHLSHLRAASVERGLDPVQVLSGTDPSTVMEGLYIKVEEKGVVKKRYKYVRGGFLQTLNEADDQGLDRPLVPNKLRSGVDLF